MSLTRGNRDAICTIAFAYLSNLVKKLLIIGPNLFFHSPAHPTAHSPKSIFHIIKMSHQASVLNLAIQKRHSLRRRTE